MIFSPLVMMNMDSVHKELAGLELQKAVRFLAGPPVLCKVEDDEPSPPNPLRKLHPRIKIKERLG